MPLALSEAKRKLTEKIDIEEELLLLEKVVTGAAQLTQQILAFSRKQVLNPKDVHLNELIKENLLFLQRVLGKNIEISTVLESKEDLVFIDSIQITQILLNLAINSRDAMPNGGRLTIETQNISFTADEEKLSVEVKAGDYVILIVSDTGCGMPKEISSKIFEPFFTTKQTGTGLGLSTVHGIVQQSKGHIWVYSEQNKGTTFKIYLPRVLNPAVAEKIEQQLYTIKGVRKKSILVVEDNLEIQKLVQQLLEREAYNVYVASSGEEGEQIATNAPAIDLLLTDTLLPSMSSRELATRILLRFPDLKIIYMSGFPKNVIAHHGVLDPGVLFIPKPFAPHQLLELMAKTLDQ
jgi:CheY-like chemotaxis protein/two-component sensor histidine kinase